MFKERKKFALLSILSALVVVSTAFVGVSIYAEGTDDSELTTFEEEAIKAGEKFEDMESKARSDGITDDSSSTTTIAEVSSLFDSLVLCDVGTTEVSGKTQTAGFDKESLTTPTVSVKVMTEAEIANETSTTTTAASSSAADKEETSTTSSSIDCVSMGKGGSTSTASKAKDDGADAATASNGTSTASAPESDDQILVIEGQDFVPRQAVLIFYEGALVGIDEVAKDGSIEIKIPVPNSGGTASTAAGNNTASSAELKFVETGTQRTGIFEFDGETLTAAAEGGEIEAESGDDGAAATMPAPSSDNATTSSESASSNNSNYTAQ
ncbi:hypothetical protein Ngar_c35270 [Candidatus Nitrososphaera gargensis Ga9.2]|uniref:Uncharacterized protein n=1 Tax=Nitrososphaera gargensis (strain Ga9.2) TaxID=1237085 RepID=K0IJZ4_NITGG|nr:hypothetical protein [Candidatus Nitrososphaera gargensis]AFU60440.1 hypothetical protein Ngar_c35270 [Candidatus Nitrososphaera gargensis Ga9.2]